MVLVDRGTASASEIVTAALQQRRGAKVVGRRTFGKGVFGQVFPLSNGGALDLVRGNYYTPNGTNLNGRGVKPNVPLSKKVSNDPRLALDRALDGARRRGRDARSSVPRSEAQIGVVGRRGRFTVVEPLFERGRRLTIDGRAAWRLRDRRHRAGAHARAAHRDRARRSGGRRSRAT